MLTVRVIPCLDCCDGRVVKGVKFQNLQDAGDPLELSVNYQQAGADELVILDVGATPNARGHTLDNVRNVRRQLMLPLTAGGGVRSVQDAQALLEAGADKVAINTAAVKDPAIIDALCARFGTQCVVLAVDAAVRKDGGDGWEIVVRSGTQRTGIDAVGWMQEAQRRGAGEILLTSWDKDGTKTGYDLPLIQAARQAVNIPVIASGGAAKPDHLVDALAAGADAVLAASILHQNTYTVVDLKRSLQRSGLEVRL